MTDSQATLMCDYSINDLNQLMFTNQENMSGTQLNSTASPYKSGGDKYTQLTKLDEDEENVDFMHMFRQFQQNNQASGDQQHFQQQMTKEQAQVQYYQQNESNSERLNQNMQGQKQQKMAVQQRQPKSNKGIRPSSATVTGQAGRFLSQHNAGQNQYGVHYGGSFSGHHFEQHNPQVNNLMNNYSNQILGAPMLGIHTSSQRNGLMTNQQSLKGNLIQKKRVRPQSAAKNQMKPAKELQSVTTFTFQKAQQNKNQRTFVPESLKNTDKERLYEDKINLKKQLNEIVQENHVLKTQLHCQTNNMKKKEGVIQNMMRQHIYNNPSISSSQQHQPLGDKFIDDFRKREIQHNVQNEKPPSKSKSSKAAFTSNQIVTKDSNILMLKSKLKDLNEVLGQRDKELLDLKQTLKFTKIKEFETELNLNVQESQRLRILLEREYAKPKIDPRFVDRLKQRILQYQSITGNQQQNQTILQENYDKQNKKLIAQVKKLSKQKETRKRLVEKNKRLEQKVQILQQKVGVGAKMGGGRNSNQQALFDQQQAHQLNQMQYQFKQKMNQQTNLIEQLLIKLQQNGIQITEQELMDMQMQQDQLNEIQEESNQDDEETRGIDLIVTYGGFSTNNTKKLNFEFNNFDHLKETLRNKFEIVDQEFLVKFLNEDGSHLEVTGNNFDKIKEMGGQGQIRLEIELLNTQDDRDEYEEDDFENQEQEKVYVPLITEEQVKTRLTEMRIILQIKNVKKGDILKYLLSGERNQQNKKLKSISLSLFSQKIHTKIGFDQEVSMLIAQFLIEKPDESNGKVLQLDTKSISHTDACTILRKDLHQQLLMHLDDYILYTGFAITSLLKRVHDQFEQTLVEIATDLDDKDYEEKGTTDLDEIYRSFKCAGLFVNQFDDDINEFIKFLALRHSKSLDEINYADLMKAFEEDYNYIDDKKSIWENDGQDYEPSSEEDEMEESVVYDEVEEDKEPSQINQGSPQQNTEELEQNVLLEKVDEILMQIVKRLPDTNKIKTLTQCMMPYLTPVTDNTNQQQFLIISQNAFIQFLLGQGPNQLGLQLDQGHIVCLLHLLVQEDDRQDENQNNRFILFDELIELIKTYMKKELIMQQSKSLGIHYDILGKESVEFLFQIRSSLMNDHNINENSGDDDEDAENHSPNKQQQSVPIHIREIFQRIIQKKEIQLKNRQPGEKSNVEVMDFESMLEILFMRMNIKSPTNRAQDELKFLMCLDFKYLEVVMLVKFDKIMHDLDYISIDLLRQAQDHTMDEQRKMNLNQLRRLRDKQIGNQKNLMITKEISEPLNQQIYQNNSQNIADFQGVSQVPQEQKKRKRPDDKKQKKTTVISKKNTNQNLNSSNLDQDFNEGNARYSDDERNKFQPNDFDNIDVDVKIDINQKDNINEMSDFDEDYSQDEEIPIIDDDDDELISDNYEQLDEMKESKSPDANAFSMDHSDDILNDSKKNMETRKSYDVNNDNNFGQDQISGYSEHSSQVEDDEEQGMDEEEEYQYEEAEDDDMDNGMDDEDEDELQIQQHLAFDERAALEAELKRELEQQMDMDEDDDGEWNENEQEHYAEMPKESSREEPIVYASQDPNQLADNSEQYSDNIEEEEYSEVIAQKRSSKASSQMQNEQYILPQQQYSIDDQIHSSQASSQKQMSSHHQSQHSQNQPRQQSSHQSQKQIQSSNNMDMPSNRSKSNKELWNNQNASSHHSQNSQQDRWNQDNQNQSNFDAQDYNNAGSMKSSQKSSFKQNDHKSFPASSIKSNSQYSSNKQSQKSIARSSQRYENQYDIEEKQFDVADEISLIKDSEKQFSVHNNSQLNRSSNQQNFNPPEEEDYSEEEKSEQEMYEENIIQKSNANRSSHSNSNYNKLKSSLRHGSSNIAQDFKPPDDNDDVEDFQVDVPSNKDQQHFNEPSGEEYEEEQKYSFMPNQNENVRQSKQSKQSNRSGTSFKRIGGENSVQHVEDNYYIEDEDDFEENEDQEEPGMIDHQLVENRQEQIRQSNNSRKEKQSEESDYEF